MLEIQVDITSRSEAIAGLDLLHHRDVRRPKIIGEDLHTKVQSHIGQEDNVKTRGIQGGSITGKRHLQQGGIRDLHSLHTETDNQRQDQAESATTHLPRHLKGDAHKALLQLAVIITFLFGPEIAAVGRALSLETGGLHWSTGLSRHAEGHPLARDQARKVNLHQSIHTFQGEIDATRHLRLSEIDNDLDHHLVDDLALLHNSERSYQNKASHLLKNSHPTPLACRRQRSYLHATSTEKIQIPFLLPGVAEVLLRDENTIAIEKIRTPWQATTTIMACIIICIEGTTDLS